MENDKKEVWPNKWPKEDFIQNFENQKGKPTNGINYEQIEAKKQLGKKPTNAKSKINQNGQYHL